jgi:hypothetical protein
MKEGSMPVFPPQQKRHLSVFAPILAWCHDRIRGIVAPPEHERGGLGEVSGVVQDSTRSGGGMPDRARYCYDASLLFRRMAILQVDRDERDVEAQEQRGRGLGGLPMPPRREQSAQADPQMGCDGRGRARQSEAG